MYEAEARGRSLFNGCLAYVLNCANHSIRHTRLQTVLSKGARKINIFHISNHTRSHEKIYIYIYFTFGMGMGIGDDRGVGKYTTEISQWVQMNRGSDFMPLGGGNRDNK